MEYLSQHIESIIFGTQHPVTFKEIHNCLNEAFETEFKEEDLVEAIEAVKERFSDDAYSFEVVQVSGGYQFMSKGVYHNTIGTYLRQSTKKRLSRAAIETLSIIAYKQPVSKPEMERIRGVSCDYSCQKLLEKELITIIGRSDGPGKPLLYGTTLKFMEYFGINSLEDMPKPKDFREVENTIGEQAPIEEGVEVEKASPIELNLEEGDTVKVPTVEDLEALIVEVSEDEVSDSTAEENEATAETSVSENIENISEEANQEEGEVITMPVDEMPLEVLDDVVDNEGIDSISEENEFSEEMTPPEDVTNNSEIVNEKQSEVITIPIDETPLDILHQAVENEASEENTFSIDLENENAASIENDSEESEMMIPNADSADEMENPELTLDSLEDNNGEIKNLAIPIVGSVKPFENTIDVEDASENMITVETTSDLETNKITSPALEVNISDNIDSEQVEIKNDIPEPQVVRKEETILIQTNRIERSENSVVYDNDNPEAPMPISIDEEDDINTISTSNQNEINNSISPVSGEDLEVMTHENEDSSIIILDDENTIPPSFVNNEEE